MFNEKGYIEFKINDYETIINYINHNGTLYGLTRGDSNKVKQLTSHNNILAGEGPEAREFVPVSVHILNNQDRVLEIYNEMAKLDFTPKRVNIEDHLVVVEVQ